MSVGAMFRCPHCGEPIDIVAEKSLEHRPVQYPAAQPLWSDSIDADPARKAAQAAALAERDMRPRCGDCDALYSECECN